MIKINKSEARKQFNVGVNVYIIPNKMSIDNMWMPLYKMNKWELESIDNSITFDKFINEYEYYNCMYETGYYCSYYLIEGGN